MSRAAGTGAKNVLITGASSGIGEALALASCPSYSASKAAVKTWGLANRRPLTREGIRMNVVCPGFVRSRITDKNTCPMPFFMEADRAARIILDRVDRNVGLIAFPWPMRFATWALSVLPAWINGLVNRLVPDKISSGRPKVL